MKKIEVAGEEWNILRDHKNHGATLRMRLKAEAVMLLATGADNEFVAHMVDRRPSTIAQWSREFPQVRSAFIHDFNLGNANASQLTASHRGQAIDVLSKPPAPDLVPARFWTVPALAAWISDRFEVTYQSDSTMVFLLHQAGLSFHKPEAFDKRRGSEDATT